MGLDFGQHTCMHAVKRQRTEEWETDRKLKNLAKQCYKTLPVIDVHVWCLNPSGTFQGPQDLQAEVLSIGG